MGKAGQCCDGKARISNGSKNKEQWTKKIGKGKFNTTAPAGEFRQGAISEVISKMTNLIDEQLDENEKKLRKKIEKKIVEKKYNDKITPIQQ